MEYLIILFPAMVAGMLVVATHIPLGAEVLKRGIVFIDLALAQTAALGSIVATWVIYSGGHDSHEHSHMALVFSAPYFASIFCASLLYLIRKASARVQEALIGSIFILASSASILILSKHPMGGEHLKDILAGQILWVRWQDIFVACVVTALVFIGLHYFRKKQNQFVFYPTLAVAITLSTQLVGVYLVFATLIMPALAVYRLKKPMRFAYCVGVVGYLSGLIISGFIDSPSGAVIVATLAFTSLLLWLVTVVMGVKRENGNGDPM